MYIHYGIPDPRLDKSYPKVRIKLVGKRSIPIFGNVTDFVWKGRDSGLKIIDRLNGDESIKHVGYGGRKVSIHLNSNHGCWVISTSRPDFLDFDITANTPSGELWGSYLSIARHLVEGPSLPAF